ncbi:MAG: DUF1150 family protein [Pseudomonadota bacterium]
MNTPFQFEEATERAIVYVREVLAKDLPREMREKLGELTTVYAVHNSDGERLALVKDRSLAFALAREHDMDPVTVH